VAVQIIQWLYTLLLIFGIYAWFARYAGRAAIWIAALTLYDAGFWDLFRQVSSELAFMPCLMWAAVLLAAAAQSRNKRRTAAMMTGAIVLTAAACAIRQAGALLVVGFVIAVIIRAMRGQMTWARTAICSAPLGICIAAVSWGLIAFDHHGARAASPAEIGYTNAFRTQGDSLTAQIAEGVRRQTAEIARLLVPGLWKAHARAGDWGNINTWVFIIVCMPVAMGWWKLCRATADPLALTLPFYIALYVVYPFDSGTRFTVPMLPVLAASIWFVISPLGSNRTLFFWLLVVMHMSVSVGYWVQDAAHVRRRWNQWPTMEHVAKAIPPAAKVIALHGSVDDDWIFLMYLSDRPVAPELTHEPVATDADWIVASHMESDWPGFHAVKQVDDFKLETRDVRLARAIPRVIGRKGS
jgi:hypothetical protein